MGDDFDLNDALAAGFQATDLGLSYSLSQQQIAAGQSPTAWGGFGGGQKVSHASNAIALALVLIFLVFFLSKAK
jgi:hypothetical protein